MPRRAGRIRRTAPGACDDTGVSRGPGRVVVVSHAGVLAANRAVYAELATPGDRRRAGRALAVAQRVRAGRLRARRSAGPSRATCTRRACSARVTRSATCTSRARAATLDALGAEGGADRRGAVLPRRAAVVPRGARRGVPYGVQVAETLDRPMPRLVARWRTSVLARAAFVVARSPKAAALARDWGASGRAPTSSPTTSRALDELRRAERRVHRRRSSGGSSRRRGSATSSRPSRRSTTSRLVVAGAGPLAERVERAGPRVDVRRARRARPRRRGLRARARHLRAEPGDARGGRSSSAASSSSRSSAAVPVVATATG